MAKPFEIVQITGNDISLQTKPFSNLRYTHPAGIPFQKIPDFINPLFGMVVHWMVIRSMTQKGLHMH